MKKTILTSIAAIAFAMPAIAANIPNDATCNSGVLGVSSGSANLEADYTANTINITWDGNGGSTPTGGATSCTYDTTFNLPAAPTRLGYTFAGWSVVEQNCFTNYSGDEDWIYALRDWSEGSQNGTWSSTSANGNVISAITKCSSSSGGTTPSDANGSYCWYQIRSYTPAGGNTCNVSSPVWKNYGSLGNSNDCATACAEVVSENFYETTGLHDIRDLFGINCSGFSTQTACDASPYCNWEGEERYIEESDSYEYVYVCVDRL